MTITIHQRPHGYVVNWKTGPGWVRDGSEIAKLRQAGMRVLKVHLKDNGFIPADQAKEWRDAGMKVWGMDWIGTGNPHTEAQWLKNERVRLALAGLDCNGEEPVRAQDVATNGQWSNLFASKLRELCPTLPLHFDTYHGSAGAGINLGAYKAKGFRFAIQTFWGQEGVWDDPTTRIVQWCAGAQPTIPKAIVKPIFRTAPNNSGQLPDWNVVFANTKAAGTKGVQFYPIESFPDFDKLLWLVKESIRLGISY